MNRPLHLPVRRNLPKHFQRIKPCFHALEPRLSVHFSNGEALDIDGFAVGFNADLFAFAIRKENELLASDGFII
jgi:hypothetical protein